MIKFLSTYIFITSLRLAITTHGYCTFSNTSCELPRVSNLPLELSTYDPLLYSSSDLCAPNTYIVDPIILVIVWSSTLQFTYAQITYVHRSAGLIHLHYHKYSSLLKWLESAVLLLHLRPLASHPFFVLNYAGNSRLKFSSLSCLTNLYQLLVSHRFNRKSGGYGLHALFFSEPDQDVCRHFHLNIPKLNQGPVHHNLYFYSILHFQPSLIHTLDTLNHAYFDPSIPDNTLLRSCLGFDLFHILKSIKPSILPADAICVWSYT